MSVGHGHQVIVAVHGIHVFTVTATELHTAVAPNLVTSITVIPIGAVTVILIFSAIGIAAMVTNLAPAPSPVLRNSHTARWPGSFMTPLYWPLPLPIGSLPQVRFVGLANGVIVFEARFTHDTGGGDSGFGGVPDERRATALARTTTIDPLPSDAESLTRPFSFVPPPMAVPSCDADGGAHYVGADDVSNKIGMDISSLLRNDGINIAPQPSISTSRGRRGSSGRPRRTDRIPTGSLTPPHTAELRRAAWRHGRRRSAGAHLPSPVTPPRVAPASLLSSSTPPQLGRRMANGRAGMSRTARDRQPPRGAAKGKQVAGGRRGAPESAMQSRRTTRSGRGNVVVVC